MRCKPVRGSLHVKLMFIKRSFGVTLPEAHLTIFVCLDIATPGNGQESLRVF
jgi:hypothetical protein